MRLLLSGAPRVESLLMRDNSVPSYHLRLIAQFCPGLTTLSLTSFHGLTDDELTTISTSCTRLKHLTLDRCISVTGQGLSAVANHCPGLASLSLAEHYFLGDDAARVMTTRLNQLHVLNIAGCMGVTREAVEEILEHCTDLEELTLDSCNVSNASMQKLPRRLRLLSLKRCAAVTSLGVATLSWRCPCLTDLSIFGLRGTSDLSIDLLARNCPRLERLDMSWCLAVTDDGFASLTACSRLERLCFSGCDKVTGGAVVKVANAARRLQHIDMSWTATDDQSVGELAAVAPSLRTVHVNWCRNITAAAISHLGRLSHRHRRLHTLFAIGCHFEGNQQALRAHFPEGSALYFQ